MSDDLWRESADSVRQPTGAVCGAASVDSERQVQSLVTRLAAEGGLAPAEGAAELARLLSEPGTSLYVQIGSGGLPTRLRLRAGAAPEAGLSVAAVGGCGVQPPAAVPPAAGVVVALWIRTRPGENGEFIGSYPPGTRRISLVANGRLVRSALAVTPGIAELTFDLDAA